MLLGAKLDYRGHQSLNFHNAYMQGSGIGGRGSIPPLAEKILKIPPEDFGKIYPLGKNIPTIFGQISKINGNLTGFSLNLV